MAYTRDKKKPVIKIEEDFGNRITIIVPPRKYVGYKGTSILELYITGMQEISVGVSSVCEDAVDACGRTYHSFFLDGDSAHALGEWLLKHTRQAEFEII